MHPTHHTGVMGSPTPHLIGSPLDDASPAEALLDAQAPAPHALDEVGLLQAGPNLLGLGATHTLTKAGRQAPSPWPHEPPARPIDRLRLSRRRAYLLRPTGLRPRLIGR